jgi:glycosyltransferase involved in cell wall biosynthesis
MKILIIIPAYNEAENIENVVNNLILKYHKYDYLVVNDSSSDRTAEICRNNNFHFIDLPVNLGLSGVFNTGMKYADINHYDMAIQFDGDGQHKAQYIDNMVKKMLEENMDIIIGSRFLEEKKSSSMRMLGNNLISFFIKLTTGVKISDSTSGMRLFSKKMIHEFAWSIDYEPEPDTISYLISKGIKIKEVQISMNNRVAGKSYLNLRRSIIYMLKICLSIVLVQWYRKRM